MEDRGFTEVDLREMLEHAAGFRPDALEGRFVVETRFRGRAWEVVVVTAFGVALCASEDETPTPAEFTVEGESESYA